MEVDENENADESLWWSLADYELFQRTTVSLLRDKMRNGPVLLTVSAAMRILNNIEAEEQKGEKAEEETLILSI